MFEKLVNDLGDGVGAFAYVAYKQQKIAFIRDFHTRHGRLPSLEEVQVFHVASSSPEAIEAFKERAAVLAADFLNNGLEDRLAVQEEVIRENVLMDELQLIRAEMERKRTPLGWLREVSSNLAVNIATIVFVGVLVTGYQAIDKISKASERIAQVVQQEEATKAAAPGVQPGTTQTTPPITPK